MLLKGHGCCLLDLFTIPWSRVQPLKWDQWAVFLLLSPLWLLICVSLTVNRLHKTNHKLVNWTTNGYHNFWILTSKRSLRTHLDMYIGIRTLNRTEWLVTTGKLGDLSFRNFCHWTNSTSVAVVLWTSHSSQFIFVMLAAGVLSSAKHQLNNDWHYTPIHTQTKRRTHTQTNSRCLNAWRYQLLQLSAYSPAILSVYLLSFCSKHEQRLVVLPTYVYRSQLLNCCKRTT